MEAIATYGNSPYFRYLLKHLKINYNIKDGYPENWPYNTDTLDSVLSAAGSASLLFQGVGSRWRIYFYVILRNYRFIPKKVAC